MEHFLEVCPDVMRQIKRDSWRGVEFVASTVGLEE